MLPMPREYELVLDTFVEGSPVAYTRMTRKSKYTEEARNYLGYQRHVTNAVKEVLPVSAFEPIEPHAMRKKTWYCLGVDVCIKNDRGDWSNYLKAVEDALQYAGLIWDDKAVDLCLGGSRIIRCEVEGVHILLGKRHGMPQMGARLA